MENSLVLSKKEFVCLMNLLSLTNIPIGINSFPQVRTEDVVSISEKFFENRFLKRNGENLIPNKALDTFLLPIANCERMVLFQKRTSDDREIRITYYASGGGVSAIYELSDDTIELHQINTMGKAIILLDPYPPFVRNLSYIKINKDFSIFHVATYFHDSVKVVECSSHSKQISKTKEQILLLEDYKMVIKKVFEELYNVSGC